MQTVLIHYASEIALKGGNRKDFENALVRNIKKSLGKDLKLKRPYGRIIIQIPKYTPAIQKKLSKIFGISWFAPVDAVKSDLDAIKKATAKLKIKGKTFKVQTKRADKRFPLTSPEINKEVGEFLVDKLKLEVNFRNPENTVFVEVTEEGSFIFKDKIKGPGGLPVGTAGKVLVLMSGGIDSPVAAFLAMKRGCHVDYLHYHALRADKDVKDTKIPKIVKKLLEYDPDSKLFLQAHHDFDVASQKAPSEFSLILFRRYMFKVAEKLAERVRAKAIITGDNLAQVASQTLDNLSTVDRGIEMPVLRPVLTYDKQDIINLAKQIDTYDLTIQPYKDCCAIISRKPKTRPKLDKVEKYEKVIDQDKLVRETINKF